MNRGAFNPGSTGFTVATSNRSNFGRVPGPCAAPAPGPKTIQTIAAELAAPTHPATLISPSLSSHPRRFRLAHRFNAILDQ